MKQATLVLKDGTKLLGKSFGADVSSAGELVFSTGMVGYPESFTDPSYTGQILVLTYPLVGNYGIGGGCKDENKIEKRFESSKIHIQGLIVNEYSENYSHWDANKSLGEWLKKNNIPAITGIDTRELTKKLREKGTIQAKILVNEKDQINFIDPNLENLVEKVSIKTPKEYKKGKKRIICIDCGMKNNILRKFLEKNISVLRVPWDYDFIENKDKFDGVFISNGPGDPELLTKLHENIRKTMKLKKPIFGICLGSQVMALAAGAKTYKLKFGHRSQNQPCIEEETGRCYITSQNHSFAVKESTLSKDWEVMFRNANDKTVEGIKHKKLPFFACQFHPEATPGPTDTSYLLDKFIEKL
jgi:carbamoyl-phosphate synthase small subunit